MDVLSLPSASRRLIFAEALASILVNLDVVIRDAGHSATSPTRQRGIGHPSPSTSPTRQRGRPSPSLARRTCVRPARVAYIQHIDQATELPRAAAAADFDWEDVCEQLGALRFAVRMHRDTRLGDAPVDVVGRVPVYAAEPLMVRLRRELDSLNAAAEDEDEDEEDADVPGGRGALVAQVEQLTRQVASLRELLDGDADDVALELVIE